MCRSGWLLFVAQVALLEAIAWGSMADTDDWRSRVADSVDTDTPIQVRHGATRSLLRRLESDFDPSECYYIASTWNRALDESDRKRLLSPYRERILELASLRWSSESSKVRFEILGLCALFAERESFRLLIETIQDEREDKFGVFCELRLLVARVRSGDETQRKRLHRVLLGELGAKRQAIVFAACLQTPPPQLGRIASVVLADDSLPLTIRLLASRCATGESQYPVKVVQIFLAALSDEEEMFYLHPYSISEDPATPREIAMSVMLKHKERFTEKDYLQLISAVEHLQVEKLHSVEHVLRQRILGRDSAMEPTRSD